jgi:NADH-ubiquinone oxidoreductase chain 4
LKFITIIYLWWFKVYNDKMSLYRKGVINFFYLFMLLSSLLLIPLLGVFTIIVNKDNEVSKKNIKLIALVASIVNFFLSLVIFIFFDFSTNQFQFIQEYHEISYFNFYLGIDGLSIYFVLLTTIIIPISLLSNWTSISNDVQSYVIIILLLETLLLAVFLVLDILLFYIFFESILPPLFILIGIFGSDNRVKASFYLFLYTLLGSLFLLLSILAMSSIMSTTDFDTLFKGNFIYITQLFLFYGIFIAFAVKTPTMFLNTWLLKAHVESPLGGSIILAAIVLKLSLYGILRLILPVLPKAYIEYTSIIYLIGVITIIYASLSTLRTIDVKELIAYSSVSHAAVYLLGVFSNSIQGIEGSISLGLAHGLVSPGLFICAGGILYDRSSTRLITNYKGITQLMPLFAILFFILCLGNCGAPLTLNFVGEFMSLYGTFERSSIFGALASSSIIFSAAYTIYMYQRISFGGSYSKMFTVAIPDLNKREFIVLLTLVVPTVIFGIYIVPILNGLHYSVSTLLYFFD